jgi:tRNA(Ile)-lysidine synthase
MMRAPSEAKLVEMLKQLTSGGARIMVEHDGVRLRVYRGRLALAPATSAAPFAPVAWKGERRIPLPALGGKLLFRRARGEGIDLHKLEQCRVAVRLRAGGERLQPDPRRPRRTLKNLFQEAGVPPWQRDRLPLLFCGNDLVWAPGLGIDAHYQVTADTVGVVPEWR